MKAPRGLFLVAVCVMFALLPLVIKDSYTLHIFVLAFMWSVVVSAWDLITGYAGIFSFAQIAFFVIGAYGSGVLAVHHHVPPWLAMPAGGAIASLVGVLIGIPCLRVRGTYVALVTYALHLVLPTLISRGATLLKTGGTGGLVNIPPLGFGGYIFSRVDKLSWYYAALMLAGLCLFLIYRLIKSSFGLALMALRDAEDLAKSLGVGEYSLKLAVFAVSAFITGLVGGFYAHYAGSVSYRLLGMDFFLLLMIMLTIGGMGRFPGAAIGAVVITLLNEFLRISEGYRLIILGAIVALVIIVMPNGLIGVVEINFGSRVNAFLVRRGRR